MVQIMKSALSFGFSMLMAVACWADGPAPFPLERYVELMSRSAFSPAAEGPAVGNAEADFAKDLVLTGVVRFNGGEFVTFATRDQKRQFGLSRGETREGIAIAGVAWSDTPGRTRVTLKKGAEYAAIGFDEAAAAAGPKPPVPPGLQVMPDHPGPMPGAQGMPPVPKTIAP
jgi:hypothetical protein